MPCRDRLRTAMSRSRSVLAPCLLVSLGRDRPDRGGFLLSKGSRPPQRLRGWRPQVLKFWEGTNIYDKMLFPNPPILPITLGPLMALPPLPAP